MSENERRLIKIKYDKRAKNVYFPKNFEELFNICENFVPNNDQNKIYQLIDVKNKKEIKTQNDFEEFNSENNKTMKSVIQLNIIDKNSLKNDQNNKLIQESSNLNYISNNLASNNKIEPEKEINIKSNEDEDEIKTNLRSMISEKLQSMENIIIEEVCQKVQNSNIPHKKRNKIKHNGVSCDNCGMKDIIGVRYKCIQCENYNLCQNCEIKNCHDINHIFIKIKMPLYDEKRFSEKIDKNLVYIKDGFDYIIEPKIINFKNGNSKFTQNVILKNSGSENWPKNFSFKCIKNQFLNGNDVQLGKNVKSGGSVNFDLSFNKVNEEENEEQKEYVICYKLIDDNDEQIGDVVEFKVIFE